jgi:tRNA (cmo5U34)-methyltransferase
MLSARWAIAISPSGAQVYDGRPPRPGANRQTAPDEVSVNAQLHWDPETYLDEIRAEVPRYDELQTQTIDAIPFPPGRVLELGVGTGETGRRLLERFPDAEVTGLDASPEMVFRARELGIEVRLARIEDPLPDGPWDLVVSVLTVHHLDDAGKRDLFRRVREQSRSLVLGDVVVVEPEHRVAPLEPGVDMPAPAAHLAEWCGGEIAWEADDLAVVRATYG